MVNFLRRVIYKISILRLSRIPLNITRTYIRTTFISSIPFFSQVSRPDVSSDRRKAVAATKLALDAYKPFREQFPGLNYPPAFSFESPSYIYREGGTFYPVISSWVEIEMPIYEVLTEFEERRIGESGIEKPKVGKVIIRGKCSANCAKIDLERIRVLTNEGKQIWENTTPVRK